MPKGQALNAAILEAALTGLEAQRQRIEEMIKQVKRMAGSPAAAAPAAAAVPARRRRLSARGRKRIVEALRKRWAEYHKQQAAGSSKAKK